MMSIMQSEHDAIQDCERCRQLRAKLAGASENIASLVEANGKFQAQTHLMSMTITALEAELRDAVNEAQNQLVRLKLCNELGGPVEALWKGKRDKWQAALLPEPEADCAKPDAPEPCTTEERVECTYEERSAYWHRLMVSGIPPVTGFMKASALMWEIARGDHDDLVRAWLAAREQGAKDGG